MTRTRRQSLSDRATRVLRALADHGPLADTAEHRVLLAAAGTPGAMYDSLLVLHQRWLIRFDEGGRNLRVTQRGRDLLRTSHYRQRPT